MSLGEAWRQHLRLSILRVLDAAPAYSANDSLLTDMVDDWGLNASRSQIRTEIAWLAEQGLVTSSEIGGIVIATITGRGQEAAVGRITAPGVKRPSPKG